MDDDLKGTDMCRVIAILASAALVLSLGLADIRTAEAHEGTELRWATSAVGSAGYRAKVALTTVLNREPPDDSITVTITRIPFFYGFHLGTDVPASAVYRMLTSIEEHAVELAQSDAAFRQIRDDRVDLKRRGVAASMHAVRVHPGLARYLRERGGCDEAWDDRVATGPSSGFGEGLADG